MASSRTLRQMMMANPAHQATRMAPYSKVNRCSWLSMLSTGTVIITSQPFSSQV